MQHPSQRLNELQIIDHALDTQRRLIRHLGNWASTEVALIEQATRIGGSAWAYVPPGVEQEIAELTEAVAAFKEAGVL